MSGNEARRRAEKIAGLREMIDFLEAHPDVPLPSASLEYCVSVMRTGADGEWGERPDEEGVAEIARIAGLLGVEVNGVGPSVEASRKFGAATYRTFFIGRQRARDWGALISYSDNIKEQ